MRAETAGARTWLLGAVALWALCVWALALAGLGGNVARLAEDPSLAGRLPQPGTVAAERLGPLPQYASIGDRPLFTDDRKPQPFLINPDGEEGEAAASFDYVLTSVMRTPDFEMAILQPSDGNGEPIRLKVGGAPKAAPGWHLTSMDARSAVFNGPDGERKLELRVFDGNGGEPPTQVTATPPQQTTTARGTSPRVPSGQPRPAQPMQPMQTPAAPGNAPATPDAANAANADADAPAAADPVADKASQEQIDSIRKRIEARRAKLRQEAQQPPAAVPNQNP